MYSPWVSHCFWMHHHGSKRRRRWGDEKSHAELNHCSTCKAHCITTKQFFNIIPLNAIFSVAFTNYCGVEIFAVLLRRYSLSCVYVTLQRFEVLADYYGGEGQIEIV